MVQSFSRGAAIAPLLLSCADNSAVNSCLHKNVQSCMVDDTGIEPVTPSMSTKCSTAELIVLSCYEFAVL